MRTLIRGFCAAALASALAAGAVFLPQAPAGAAAAGGSGGCVFQPPNTWICLHSVTTPGRPGSGGRQVRFTCTLTPLSKAQARFLGLHSQAPRGYTWDAITCPGTQPFGGTTLVNRHTHRPLITPRQLLQIALGRLVVPGLSPQTAPPRGSDGLVGLPEWLWIPRGDWRPVSVTVTAGPVWARATAVPLRLAFAPGGGLPGIRCPGPGTPYNRQVPAAAQHTNCSYTYDQSSAGQPGSAYQATLTVIWRVSWTGSGGAGGVVNDALRDPAAFPIRVAEGQALVGSG